MTGSILALLRLLLEALTSALKALPILAAWKINREIEGLNRQILKHEAANTVNDRATADELRVQRAYRLKLHDALLPAVPATGNRDKRPDA